MINYFFIIYNLIISTITFFKPSKKIISFKHKYKKNSNNC